MCEKINKEEFEESYCEQSQISLDYYNENFVSVECHCEYEGCRGWIAANKTIVDNGGNPWYI